MKSIISTLLLSLLIISCEKKTTFTVTEKDNIKTYINRNDPSAPDLTITLEPLFEIDFNGLNTDTAMGFKNPIIVDCDKNNNVFILDIMLSKISKFNSEGKFQNSFCRQGDGPGEARYPSGMAVKQDTVLLSVGSKRTILKFDLAGNYIGQSIFNKSLPTRLNLLNNGVVSNYLVRSMENDKPFQNFNLGLFDENYELIKNLYEYKADLTKPGFFNDFINIFPPYAINDTQIFVSKNTDTEYKIDAYKSNGEIAYHLTKNYRTISINKNEKESINAKTSFIEGEPPLDISSSYKKPVNYLLCLNDSLLLAKVSLERNDKNKNITRFDIFKSGVYQNSFETELLTPQDFFYDNLYYTIKNNRLYELNCNTNSLKVFNIKGI